MRWWEQAGIDLEGEREMSVAETAADAEAALEVDEDGLEE